MNKILDEIKIIASSLGNIKLMEVCGGHTHTIVKHGIRNILPKNIELVSGPGCPVCVTSQKDIDAIIEIAKSGVHVVTYGDMMRVPGTHGNLDDARADGAKVSYVYSATEVPDDAVFFGIGFETTTPMTAYLLKKGIKVYSAHKVMMPAMELLTKSDNQIDGFILPGHVSAITGSKEWDSLKIPGVIAGFEERHIMYAVKDILNIIKNKENNTINDYKEAVTPNGNTKAQELIKEQFKMSDVEWRGLGTIPLSGLDPKDESLDAKIIFKDLINKIKSEEPKGCKCGDVIAGLINPKDCPLFKKNCSPNSPVGACMVSREGAFQIEYSYGH